MIAELLIEQSAEVNGDAPHVHGRYSIEGAADADHGRLDMIHLLLNAGAKGNMWNGTSFEETISLAKKNGHFVVADLLQTTSR